jgi:hypothetical protein
LFSAAPVISAFWNREYFDRLRLTPAAFRLVVTKTRTPLKTLLREEAIPALAAERPYFSVGMVRKGVAARKWRLADAT